MDFFIADTHFSHANIIKHCNRPFSNVVEMDEAILDGINSLVQPNDTLYHLGDFAWKKNVARYREKIRCRNVILILGNHDPQTKLGQPQDILYDIFSQVFVMLRIRRSQRQIILSHYAMRTWNGSHRGSWNLFGHSHGTLSNNGSMSLDVGVDNHAYCPVSINNIIEIMKSKQKG